MVNGPEVVRMTTEKRVMATQCANRLSEAGLQCYWQENRRRAVGNRLTDVPAERPSE